MVLLRYGPDPIQNQIFLKSPEIHNKKNTRDFPA